MKNQVPGFKIEEGIIIKHDQYLPIDQCKKNYLYLIKARNARLGVFVPDQENGFLIAREKFGFVYAFVEYHWDNGPPFGTVRPIEEICEFSIDVQDPKQYDEKEFIRLISELDKGVCEHKDLERENQIKLFFEEYRARIKNPVTRRQLLDEINAEIQATNEKHLQQDDSTREIEQRPIKTMREYEDELVERGYEIEREPS